MKQVYELFVEKMMGTVLILAILLKQTMHAAPGICKDEVRSPPFGALDALTYPELHHEALPEMTFYTSLLKLMRTVGLHDCTLQVCSPLNILSLDNMLLLP